MYQNDQPLNSHNPQYPQTPAYLHQPQHDQQSSRYIDPYQPDNGAYGPPPSYAELQNCSNATFRSGPPDPNGMQATGQRPAYPDTAVYDPRPVVVTYPPSATGQCIVSQSLVPGGRPYVFVVQQSLEDPPPDYMGYSRFVACCCCWILGVNAVSKSKECRRAIAVGNRELAEEKSNAARDAANASLFFGLLEYIVTCALIIWVS